MLRTEQTIISGCSQVEKQLLDIEEYAHKNEMQINQKKTKLMLFNPCRIYDFQPDMELSGVKIEVVKQMKLLGVAITDDLKWHENTSHITKKAYSRLWILRRLKSMGASVSILLDVYNKQIRSILEYAAVVWNAGLKKEDVSKIERVQKSAFAIILGSNYNCYEEACNTLSMHYLTERRKTLSLKFARKASNHPIHNKWFVRNPEDHYTRLKKPTFKPVCGRTERFLNSPIPYFTNLLNNDK